MKFTLAFADTYPHPPEKLWRALSEPAALGQWLMQTDFAPEPGRAFTMWCDDGAGGTDTYRCRLLEYDPPRRMVWSWRLESRSARPETTVEFVVERIAGGARLTITHSGDRDEATVERFRSGWPAKLEALRPAITALD